jgi:hypothetical protein
LKLKLQKESQDNRYQHNIGMPQASLIFLIKVI